MIINGVTLLDLEPIDTMLTEKHRQHGVSHGLGEVGYDIRIKQTIRFWPSMMGCGRIEVETPGVETIDYHDGRFVLASAMERFQMPPHLAGIVHDKSSWARRGLSVFNTVIEPGWNGFLTLELVYHGQQALEIPAGAGIAQVIFHHITHPARYEGKYQDQEDRPVAAIDA
jgi:dCTP deaminase